jgi:hypothetical protein
VLRYAPEVEIICRRCGQVIGKADSCIDFPTLIVGDSRIPHLYGRIRFGDEDTFADGRIQPPPHCHDCLVIPGGFHHPDCCVADCPHCRSQLMSCECIYEDDPDWDPEWMKRTN